ncbi:MAG: hypothetical protein EAZ95_02455 [Bacteroidetes bacterium]|nr:MAG: hypothetical protein EAZ95_02455 [Bacteroidota bacterium]
MEQSLTAEARQKVIDRINELGLKIKQTRIANREASYAYAREVLKLSTEIDYPQGIAEARVMFAAETYFRKGLVVEALQHLEQALGILQDTDSYALSWLYTVYGNIHWRMGDFDKGFEYMQKSITLTQAQNDITAVAWTKYLMASFYAEMKQYENAETFYQQALEIFEQDNDVEGYTSTLSGLGNLALARKEYNKSIEYSEKALPIALREKLVSVESRVYNDLGTVYEQLGEYPKALEYLHKSYTMREETQNVLGMSTTELNLGRIYTFLKDYANALLYFEKAVESANKVLANPRLQRAYQGLAEVYKQLDKPKEALVYFEKYIEIHTIVSGEENDAKYATLEAKHDLEKTKQEAEIHKLKNIELKQANDLIAQQNQYIIEEKIKSERLLLNILPEEVAEELKEKGHATPKFYDQATIIFTDFKGFTNLVEQVQPQDIIEDLNTCFLAFDEICEEYNLEKIKTIGDAYMAVGGVPLKNKTNPLDAVKAGLAMQAFMQKWKAEKEAKGLPAWELRVGVHTGCLIAGVIGKNKFAYDVWGDSVNIASRMESSGEVGKVNISQTTYELVKHRFACEPRGKVQAKNKGEIEMYFVVGEQA